MPRRFTKSVVGRPRRILEEDLKKIIYEYIAYAPNKIACNAAGIAYSVFCEWMNRGEFQFNLEEENREENEALYLDFYINTKKAQALRPIKMVQKIIEHSEKHWQAAAWVCERLNPEEYALKRDELEKKLDDTMSDIKELRELVKQCKPESIPEMINPKTN